MLVPGRALMPEICYLLLAGCAGSQQGVPGFNVRLEKGWETHVSQVNKRHIEERDGKGAGLAFPRAASDMSSPVAGGGRGGMTPPNVLAHHWAPGKVHRTVTCMHGSRICDILTKT